MNDLYKEIMVKPRPSQTNALKKGLLIAAAVLVFAAGMLFVQPLVMLGGIVLLFLEIWLIFPRFSVEYEYLYVNGDIDIIVTKSVSRFGRNALDTLNTLRDLRQHHIDVFFENENLHSLRHYRDRNFLMRSAIFAIQGPGNWVCWPEGHASGLEYCCKRILGK